MGPRIDRVELCLSTVSIPLAKVALDFFILHNMAMVASLLLEKVDGCVMLVKVLTVSLSLCKYDPSSPL